MTRIAFFTTTRADFGILYPLIRAVSDSGDFEVLTFAGGTHLSAKYGNTINEIYQSAVKVDATFNYISDDDSSFGIAESMSTCTQEVARLFHQYQFDLVCILGDRTELIPIALNCILFHKPILHIHGGEKTEGAMDEQVRHMITKAAHLHFASSAEYAQNIRKMGESEWRICNCGALSIDTIVETKLIPKAELFNFLGLNPNLETILLTFHPETLELGMDASVQLNNIFEAINQTGFQLVITAPNADRDRNKIVSIIEKNTHVNSNQRYFESLGHLNYLSLIPHCKFVIGNSSSGLIEVPFFRIPAINIGNRQKGRIQHVSVINSDYSVASIKQSIEKALSPDFLSGISKMKYKFGDGTASAKILNKLRENHSVEELLRKQLDFPN